MSTLLSKIVSRLDDLRARVPQFPWSTRARSLQHAKEQLDAARAMAKAPPAPAAAAGAPAKRSLLGVAERACPADLAEHRRLVAARDQLAARIEGLGREQARLDQELKAKDAPVARLKGEIEAKQAQLAKVLETSARAEEMARAQVAAFGFVMDDFQVGPVS